MQCTTTCNACQQLGCWYTLVLKLKHVYMTDSMVSVGQHQATHHVLPGKVLVDKFINVGVGVPVLGWRIYRAANMAACIVLAPKGLATDVNKTETQ